MACKELTLKPEGFMCSEVSKIKVTAVKFINKYLYCGIGGNLNIYNIDVNYNYTSLLRKNILDYNNIYGIHADCNEKNIVVHGGKLFRVVPTYPMEWPCEFPWKVKDWIWHAKWLNDGTIAIIMGHNELFIFRWHDRMTLKLIACEEKCILYSGFVIGDNFDYNLVVLSGTVYKEVLIWVPSKNLDCKTVIHRLKGHNGVIFSVNYDMKSQCICSTSDDRTIRLWKISLPSAFQQKDDNINYRILSLNEWKLVQIEPLFCIFGHSARVFRSCMISDERVLSIGEDSFLCVWNNEGKIILKQETHQGGAVCCLDYNEDLKVAVTGGADGGINLWPIPELLNKNNNKKHKIITFTISSPPVVPSRIKLMDHDKIIITGRNSSGLFIYDSDSNWVKTFDDIRILNYCLLDVSSCRKFIALASIQGYLIILRVTSCGNLIKILDEKISEDKIFSVHWLTEFLLLCCCNKGLLLLCKLTNKQGCNEDPFFDLKVEYRLILPKSKERWLTSAVLYCHYSVNDGCEKQNEILICGDRCGSIHVYDLLQASEEPVQTLFKIHDRMGVSSIHIYDTCVWSTGRDGCLRQFTLDKNEESKYFQLTPVSVDKLTLPWGAKIIYTDYLGILVLGFHEMDLVVWSVRSRVALWRLECGGGHREWDCSVNNDKNEINFYFLKDKSINLISKKLETIACPPLLDGFHTREVNALSVLAYFAADNNSEGAIIASGGEDTTIRISLVSVDLWQPVLLLTGHLSSIRTIANLKIENSALNVSKYLLFTAGGRAQLKIWSLDIDYRVIPFQLKGTEKYSHMLRGGEKIKRPWREALPTIDPETRYMDLSVEYDHHKKSAFIFAACSDGCLRIFSYDILLNTLEAMFLFEYGRCLLKSLSINFYESFTEHFNIEEKTAQLFAVISTSTDGKIAFWNFAKEQPIFVIKTHQSGVNCIDFFAVNDGRVAGNSCSKFLIASGGDDCSVVVNVVSFESVPKSSCDHLDVDVNYYKLHSVSSWSSQFLHASQVSGIKLTDKFIISVSVDHRINVWSWNIDFGNELSINFVGQYISQIADIHGIEMWNKTKDVTAICVYGVGVEVIHIDTKKICNLLT